ncbi:hypothetical protein SAE02_33350 [Skermanella aerolata]|uniref:Uncharacterized protein n=1 Tax=Skermanella aerolata TaxID=393310 RepID=A0A512DRW3_9PROT|nr:hypothetical protein SAE02_33350 [Skermanella aerolata]
MTVSQIEPGPDDIGALRARQLPRPEAEDRHPRALEVHVFHSFDSFICREANTVVVIPVPTRQRSAAQRRG